MKNVPEKIYLQIDADGERPEDFEQCNEVSWRVDQINQNDLVFYSEDYVQKRLEEADAKNRELQWEVLKLSKLDERIIQIFKKPVIGTGIPEGGKDYPNP